MATAIVDGACAEDTTLPEPDAANLRAFIELVRADLKTQKALVMAQNMDLTQDEAVEFWPLYREYDFELAKQYDKRLAIIKKYIGSYDALTEKEATTLAQESLALEEDRTGLKRKYYKSFSKIITAKKALRFFQIENQLNSAIDLRLAASLPLIK